MAKPLLIVVDDDAGTRNIIRTVGEELGFEVEEAATVKKFLPLFEKKAPDLIVLDIVMPETHGIQLLETLEKKHSRAAMIIITGYGQNYLDAATKMVTERGLTLLGGLNKPLHLANLKKMMRKAISDS